MVRLELLQRLAAARIRALASSNSYGHVCILENQQHHGGTGCVMLLLPSCEGREELKGLADEAAAIVTA